MQRKAPWNAFGFEVRFSRALQISTKKSKQAVALLRKLQNILLRSALLTIYKCFVGSHLDYGNIIYDQAFSDSFHQKVESLQYDAALAIRDTIRGTLKEKELYLESLQQRYWYRKLRFFFKIYKTQCPKYLFDIILQFNSQYRTRNAHIISQVNVKFYIVF